jgi:hypothetical protein
VHSVAQESAGEARRVMINLVPMTGISGPGWNGTLPQRFTDLKSPTAASTTCTARADCGIHTGTTTFSESEGSWI